MNRILLFGALAALVFLAGCAHEDTHHKIIISTTDQRMFVLQDNVKIAEFPVSTSKFGEGDQRGSNDTPLGLLKIKQKIGSNAPAGAVFKSRRRTGEVIVPDAPGRDPIVTRILWLEGMESHNRNAFSRCIYIHGTPEERNIGTPASYGCIRMKSADVIVLYETVGVGARVLITTRSYLPPPSPPPVAAATVPSL
ncbi:hypothetical protein BH09VER1_BH09VER1_53320 [soil metagenome]